MNAHYSRRRSAVHVVPTIDMCVKCGTASNLQSTTPGRFGRYREHNHCGPFSVTENISPVCLPGILRPPVPIPEPAEGAAAAAPDTGRNSYVVSGWGSDGTCEAEAVAKSPVTRLSPVQLVFSAWAVCTSIPHAEIEVRISIHDFSRRFPGKHFYYGHSRLPCP